LGGTWLQGVYNSEDWGIERQRLDWQNRGALGTTQSLIPSLFEHQSGSCIWNTKNQNTRPVLEQPSLDYAKKGESVPELRVWSYGKGLESVSWSKHTTSSVKDMRAMW